jgi:hypothetical protein
MSTFLGGILTPAERNKMALQKELELRRRHWRHGTYYSGAGDLLLNHGRFYEGEIIPEAFRPLVGEQSQCYGNALLAAEADPRLTYCEGVFSTGFSHYTSHAWCVYNGHVVEMTLPTWEITQWKGKLGPGGVGVPYMPPDHWGYWGITFRTELVRAIGDTPLLDRPTGDAGWEAHGLDVKDDRTAWPILEKPYRAQRTTL